MSAFLLRKFTGLAANLSQKYQLTCVPKRSGSCENKTHRPRAAINRIPPKDHMVNIRDYFESVCQGLDGIPANRPSLFR